MSKKQAKTSNTLAERNTLNELYVKRNLNAVEVARRMGWGERTVYDRLKYHGITGDQQPPAYCKHCGHVIEDDK